MRIAQDIIDRVAASVNILDIVSHYTPLKQKSGRWWGCCPFHQEKTPSFTVDDRKGLFYCFGCGEKGNVFQFLMKIEGLSFVDSVCELAAKAGIEIQQEQSDGKPGLRRQLLELNQKLIASFQHFLLEREEGKKPLSYLQQRGFHLKTIKDFRIGFLPSKRGWLYHFLTKKNYSADFLDKSGLFSARKKDYCLFQGRIIFPISDYKGDVIAFGGRSLEDNGPKYINSPETVLFHKKKNLFGLDLAWKSINKAGSFYLVEGYLDVLALYQAGIQNTAAPLGTAFTIEQARLLSRAAQSGTFVFDGDEAGTKAALKSIPIAEASGLKAEVVGLVPGSDPADIIQKSGPEQLKKVLKSGINSFDYLLEHASKRFSVHTAEGREQIILFLKPFFDSIVSEVRKETYFQKLAEEIQISQEAIKRDFVKTGSDHQFIRKEAKKDDKVKKEWKISQDLYLMLAIILNPDYFYHLRNEINMDDLSDPGARMLYIALEEAFRENELTYDKITTRIDDEALLDLVYKKAASGEFDNNQQQIITDSARTVKCKSLEMQRKKIVLEIRHIERSKASDNKLREVLLKKMYLDNELNKYKGDMND